MKKYKVVLFDLDDTLIDNVENVRYGFRKVLEVLGKDYTEELFKQWYDFDKQFWVDFHLGKIEVPKEYATPQPLFVQYVRSIRFKTFFEDKMSLEKCFELNELFIKALDEVVFPIDGAYETLEYLSKKYRLIIATNGPRAAVRAKLGKIQCFDFVDGVFSADMTKQTVTKPKKEFFEELKAHFGLDNNDDILIIGDSLYYEVQGGMNAKIDSCWFNSKEADLPSEYSPTMVITRLTQLIELL